jgi:hypothetical protein
MVYASDLKSERLITYLGSNPRRCIERVHMARKYSNHTAVCFVMLTPEEKALIKSASKESMLSQNEIMRRGMKLYIDTVIKPKMLVIERPHDIYSQR